MCLTVKLKKHNCDRIYAIVPKPNSRSKYSEINRNYLEKSIILVVFTVFGLADLRIKSYYGAYLGTLFGDINLL